jgi:uncharacterized lipoprotein YmbA
MNPRALLLPSLFAVAAVLAFLQTGCAHSDPSRFYLLTPTVAPASGTGEGTVGLRVHPLPDYLRRPELATRTSPHEVSYDEFSRWAEPLDRALPEILAADLGHALGQAMVPLYPWSSARPPTRIIQVRIERFDADAGGTVTLAATVGIGDSWREENVTVKAAAPVTPSTVVAAQCQALGELAQRLAK